MNTHVWYVTEKKKTTNECIDEIYYCQDIQQYYIF
jgi:hypothetical protein